MLYVTAGTIFFLGLFTPISDVFTIPVAALLAIGAYVMSRAPKQDEAETTRARGRNGSR